MPLTAQQLSHTGLVAWWHVGSSPTREEAMFPALAGGFLTIGPPRKSHLTYFQLKTHFIKTCFPFLSDREQRDSLFLWLDLF